MSTMNSAVKYWDTDLGELISFRVPDKYKE